MAEKKLWHLRGCIEKIGPVFDERVWAYSERQAKWLIYRRMDWRYPHRRNFILWESVEEVKKSMKSPSSESSI